MRKTFFREFAEKVGGKFYFQDEDVSIGNGVYAGNVVYVIKFKYKDCDFSILNTTGISYEAKITCKLTSLIQPIDFEITSISHIKNLFLRKKSRFKTKAENQNIAFFLEKSKALKALSALAQKDNYSPWMVCSSAERSIVTKYHLEFDDWTEVIEPTIRLYKDLIDEFEKGIAHVNHTQYRNTII